MWKFISLLVSCTLLALLFHVAENATLTIPLVRQKSVREKIIASPDKYKLHQHWLESKNFTNHSVALYRFFDTEFYANIVLGHPGKTFRMALDTAWSISWVLSSQCGIKTVGCWFHNKYNHKDSSSYKENGTAYVANEGTYNLTGYYSEDSFSIGQIRVNNQSFVEMTSVPWTYMLGKMDGILGLAMKTSYYQPFFYNMFQNKSNNISQPLFSIYLNRDRQSSRGGNVFLGFVEKKHIHVTPNKTYEPITYLPVVGVGYWQFQIDKVIVNEGSSKKQIVLCPEGCIGIVDSSNNIIVGPSEDVAKIHDYFQAKEIMFGRWMVNCDTVNKLQPIEFVLGGKNFTLKNDRYIQKMSYAGVSVCVSAFTTPSAPSENGVWVLGGAFLSEFYSVYDIANRKIGFVKAA